MAQNRLWWVDIGMAVAVGVLIAIVVFFRNAESYVPLMVAYAIGLVAWALLAEFAEVRFESAHRRSPRERATKATRSPLPH